MAIVRLSIAVVVAAALAAHGLRKGSLNKSGAAAAFVVGFASLGCGARFGLALLLFYYSSSKLTKYKAERKAKLEEGAAQGEGQRNHVQVLSCSIVGVVLCLWHAWQFGLDAQVAVSYENSKLQSSLVVGYLSHFAVCNGDTWASEIGVLSKSEPFLITRLRSCPPGTNGGVSLLGTVAAVAGGAFVGAVFAVTSWFELGEAQLLPFLGVGAVLGLVGSTVDSVLGATLQASYLNKKSGRVAGHGVSNELLQSGQYKHICGRAVLTNEQVNLVSALVCSVFGAMIGPMFFG